MRELIEKLGDIVSDIETMKWYLEGGATEQKNLKGKTIAEVVGFYSSVSVDMAEVFDTLINKYGGMEYSRVRRIRK